MLFNQRSMKLHNLVLYFHSLLVFRKSHRECIRLKEGKYRALDKVELTWRV